MKRRKKARGILLLAVLAIAFAFMTPEPARAANGGSGLTVSSVKKSVSVKKKKAGTYQVTLKAGTKNAPLTVKANKKTVTKKCKWKSSNKKVVAVTKAGKITAKKAGTAKIMVTYKGKKATLKVTALPAKEAKPGETKNEAPAANEAKSPCEHVWERHCVTNVAEGWIESNGYSAFCACGRVFLSYEAFREHLMDVSLSRLFESPEQKICGMHGEGAECEAFSESSSDSPLSYYKIVTTYVDCLYCAKCGERVTDPER